MAITLDDETEQALYTQYVKDRQELEDIVNNALLPAIAKYQAKHAAFNTNLDGAYAFLAAMDHDVALLAWSPAGAGLNSMILSAFDLLELLVTQLADIDNPVYLPGGYKYTYRSSIPAGGGP